MRIDRIARNDALYYSSVSAQTFETIGEEIINPRDSAEFVDADLAKSIQNIAHGGIQCFDEFMSKFPKSKSVEFG